MLIKFDQLKLLITVKSFPCLNLALFMFFLALVEYDMCLPLLQIMCLRRRSFLILLTMMLSSRRTQLPVDYLKFGGISKIKLISLIIFFFFI
jgi:hypothetical protein